MASTTRRHWFGGPAGEFVAALRGVELYVVAKANATLYVYDAAVGGNRIQDLKDASGNDITEITCGADGTMPRFQARIGDTQVWVGAPEGGARTLVLATDLDEDLAQAETDLQSVVTPSLDNLTDVDVSGAGEGDVLGLTGGLWGPVEGGGGVSSWNGQTGAITATASDVDAANVVHQHAASDIVSGTISTARLPVGTSSSQVAVGDHQHALGDLSNVSTAGAVEGQTLVKSGSNWVPGAASGGGVTSHAALTGLGSDDHTQYHTDARGDARYFRKQESTAPVQVNTGNEVRPTSAGCVFWIERRGPGVPQPINMTSADIWFKEE